VTNWPTIRSAACWRTPVADTLKRVDDRTAGGAHRVARRPVAGADAADVSLRPADPALAEHAGGTDEASAVEAAGLKPRLVRADASNLKVTYPADLRLAEMILQATARGGE
jgi:2-C-methyl-D-erythritol 4-phosphate cytidylyltransferase